MRMREKNRLKGKKVVEIYIYIYMSFARRHLLWRCLL